MESVKKYIAEFIGTFFLVFIGVGAIIVNQLSDNSIGHLGIAFNFGLVITVMIYACGHISGAHFNPAVTIAFIISGDFPLNNLIQYLISQLLGAISASLLLKLFFGSMINLGCTLPALPKGSAVVPISFVMEFIFTFCLMFVIKSVSTDSRAEGSFVGLSIGFTVFFGSTCGRAYIRRFF